MTAKKANPIIAIYDFATSLPVFAALNDKTATKEAKRTAAVSFIAILTSIAEVEAYKQGTPREVIEVARRMGEEVAEEAIFPMQVLADLAITIEKLRGMESEKK